MRKHVLLAFLLIVLLAAPPRTARAAVCGDTYTIQPGDTLYAIAEQCGMSYVVLSNINYEISDPGRIHPGQVIRLTAEVPLEAAHPPASGAAQPGGLQADGSVYVVRKGDSLARIAYYYHTSVYDLYLANPELSGKPVIYLGQSLLLPFGAQHTKGWVGVSSLAIWSGDTLQVRLADFPPYAPVTFRLHQKEVDGNFNGYYDPDYYFVDAEATTDARGSAHASLEVPYWAILEETWVVEADTIDLGAADTTHAVSVDLTVEYGTP